MTGAEQSPTTRAEHPTQATHQGFYRAFEEGFRGSRELIRSRLGAYLPFIEPLKSIDSRPAAVDLGCGRGEWLELLTDNGFDVRGVDLDEGMLSACHERGLRADKGDAVAFLEQLPNESQAIVSGFHIAEHLPFSKLAVLVQEALRVLKPGGLLILETPNPENFRVSSLSFYYDPTHHRPLPSELLSFLTEYQGFARVKVVRLHETGDPSKSRATLLGEVLSGSSSLDYAVIAQKAGAEAIAQLLGDAFGKEHGLAARVLVERFDAQLINQNKRLETLERRLNEERNARAALEAQHAALYTSVSWRIPAPLRSVRRAVDRLLRGSRTWLALRASPRPHRVVRQGAVSVARFLFAWLRLGKPVKHLLRRFPAIHMRLRTMLLSGDTPGTSNRNLVRQHRTAGIRSDLPRRARCVYAKLKAAIAKHERVH